MSLHNRVSGLAATRWGVLAGCLLTFNAYAADSDCPRIVHGPITTVVRGTPADLFAHIDCPDESTGINRASIYVRVTKLGKPAPIRMRSAGGTAYEAIVPVSMFAGVSRFWYYVEGVSGKGETNQTPWFPVTVIGAEDTLGAAAGASAVKTAWWKNPYVWAGGAVVIGGGALVAVNSNDDGGSDNVAPAPVQTQPTQRRQRRDNDDDDDDDTGGGFDPDQVVTISAVGTATGGFSTEPQDQVIDGSLLVAGRQVQGIRCTVNFQAYSVPDQFQIIYQGLVLADSGDVSGGGTIQGTSAGSSPQCTVRVITATGGTAWDWTAILEISVSD